MQKDLTKVDFAKNKTDFREEFNAMREQLIVEMRKKVRAKGLISYLIYLLTEEPALINWY